MRTVNEVSRLTGISVRTLHYYDEINLLKPSGLNESGYRLYDDKALEKLQQILFFKEFELPLKKIKTIMNNPYFDRNQTLLDQKELLVRKRDRLNGLIALIDGIMKGEKNVSFEAFSNTELEEMFDTLLTNANTELLEKMTREHGSVEGWKKHFVEAAGSEKSRDNMAKLIQWYGSKEKAMEASKNPPDAATIKECQDKNDEICKRIREHQEKGAESTAVQALMQEYGEVSKVLFHMEDVKQLLTELGKAYLEREEVIKAHDKQYGKGASKILGEAMIRYGKA